MCLGVDGLLMVNVGLLSDHIGWVRLHQYNRKVVKQMRYFGGKWLLNYKWKRVEVS